MRRRSAALKRHWPFLILLGLGIGLRVLVTVAYRPAILYIDSVASYLLPLPTLDPTGQDPIGYDMYLLGPVLRVGHLSTVAAVQHLLGLGIAVGAYALLVGKGAGRWLATLATVPVLLDAYQVQIEHNIMSDPLFEALVVGALVALAWRTPGELAVVGAGLLLGAAVTVRQVGEVLVVPLVLYPLLVVPGWRRRAGLSLAALACFALPVALYASYYHGFTGRYAISHAGGNALYGRVATFADCTGLALPDDERVLCPGTPRAQRPGPDFWAHDPTSPFFVLQNAKGPAADDLAQDFALRVIRHQPLDFAGSVLADAAKALSWNRVDQSPSDPPVDRWHFQVGFPFFYPLVSMDEIGALSHQYGDGDPVAVTPLTTFLRGYQLHVGYTPGPVLAVAALLALGGVLPRARRTPAGAPALLFLATGVLVLLAGDVAMFSWRYQLPGFVLLPVAGALGLTALRRSAASARPGDRPALAPFPDPVDEAALAGLDPAAGFPPVVVLVAAYNEAEGLGAVLDTVPATCAGLDVAALVVVDGATDATAQVARKHGAFTVAVPVNRGQGAALRLGYHLAVSRGATYVVTTDADGQYDLAELPLLLEPLRAGEADFVTGSRRLGANESTDPVRRAGTRVFAALVSVLTRHRVTDTSFGFRAMRAEVPVSVPLTQPQYQSAELLVGVLRRGYRVVERPMMLRRRSAGRSKKGNNLVYGARYARVVLGTWWRERNTTRSSSTNLTRNSAP